MSIKSFEKARPRLLVICKNTVARNNLVTLLTGYGYYVDYEESRASGIINYREHKQPIIIMDVSALPQYPERIFKIFNRYRRNPVILVAASEEEESQVYPYMEHGVFDIVRLPLKPNYQHFILRRLVEHSNLLSKNEYLNILTELLVLSLPLWLYLIYILF